MDAQTIKAMLEQHFEFSGTDPDRAHEMYTEDAVLEFPQSGERFIGVENMREWRSRYPAQTSITFRETRARDDLWITELSVRYDDGPEAFSLAIHELRGDKIARETIYYPRASSRRNGAPNGGPSILDRLRKRRPSGRDPRSNRQGEA